MIVAEIEKIIADPILAVVGGDNNQPRSIGVISLIGAEQAAFIQKKLMERIGEAAMVRHRIMCGDSATFQGDERHIIFLSMIADKKRKQAQTATQYEQRIQRCSLPCTRSPYPCKVRDRKRTQPDRSQSEGIGPFQSADA